MRNKNLTQQELDSILFHRALGLSYKQIAEKLEISEQSAQNVIDAFEAVKEEDWARCCNLIVKRVMGIKAFRWAADRLGKEIPQVVETAYQEDLDKRNEANAKKKAEAPLPAAPPAAGVNEQVFFQRILEEMMRRNELLEQLMDVVLPKYAADLKDNINANSDVLCGEIRKCAELLDTINVKLRKRGM